ncbi:MAG: hypothetical protein R3C03_22240 [Pirellulaceae bacterium]
MRFVLAIFVVFFGSVHLQAQDVAQQPTQGVLPAGSDDSTAQSTALESTDLKQRVELLEKKLESLEQIVFATSQLTVYESERRLKDAEFQLRERRELFLKGMLDEYVYQQDQLRVEILKQELQIAHSARLQRSNVMQIECLQAKSQLLQAEDQLARSRQLAQRGYATIDQVHNDEQWVELAKRQLALAEKKLNAVKQLATEDQKPDEEVLPNDPNSVKSDDH